LANSKILVVYYSRSGTTRTIAQAIERTLSCDIEEIRDRSDRSGMGGYIRACFDSIRNRPGNIDSLRHDPGAYDLVIVGTPVWAHSMSAPVRSFLASHGARLKDVAFFCTLGGSGAGSAFAKMQALLGKKPRATCAITAGEVASGRFAVDVARFVKELVVIAAGREDTRAAAA
jgi:menaquinone-dependent protoporphyrinogen IX oxidase